MSFTLCEQTTYEANEMTQWQTAKKITVYTSLFEKTPLSGMCPPFTCRLDMRCLTLLVLKLSSTADVYDVVRGAISCGTVQGIVTFVKELLLHRACAHRLVVDYRYISMGRLC
jgi:hypothetical protein